MLYYRAINGMNFKNKPSKKNYFNEGKWVEKPRRSEILVCSCGNKYIKTRPGQKTCVTCIVKATSVQH